MRNSVSLRNDGELLRSSRCYLRVNFIFLVRQFEKLVVETNRLSRAKNQITAGVERVMKLRDAALVQFRAQINEHIAATDQVEPGKWRVGRDVLSREGADVAHIAMDLVSAVALDEESFQSRGRDIFLDRAGIN